MPARSKMAAIVAAAFSGQNHCSCLTRRGHSWTVERLRRAVHRLVREKIRHVIDYPSEKTATKSTPHHSTLDFETTTHHVQQLVVRGQLRRRHS